MIFKNAEALQTLVDTFSNVKDFTKYIDLTNNMFAWSEKAVENSNKIDFTKTRRIRELENLIQTKKIERDRLKLLIDQSQNNIDKMQSNLDKFSDNEKIGEEIKILDSRIEHKTKLISEIQKHIKENYTVRMLDENWILFGLENITNDFYEKVNSNYLTKRKMQSNFDIEKGIKRGEKLATQKLAEHIIPLPINVPSVDIMKELLNDEHCKVCNRPAPKGSKEYQFIEQRLQEYLEHTTKPKEEEEHEEFLFQNDYIDKLYNFSTIIQNNGIKIKSIKKIIAYDLDCNTQQKIKLKQAEDELEKELEQKAVLLSNSSLEEAELKNLYKNIRNWIEQIPKEKEELKSLKTKFSEIIIQIENYKNERESIVIDGAINQYVKSSRVLKHIKQVFKNAKEKNLESFVSTLQNKSNEFLKELNQDGFTGIIKLKRHEDKTIKVLLENNAGRLIPDPNRALEVTMQISVLFGISELAKESRESVYPLIFDAPTSSFGSAKTQDFYNFISKSKKQCIIATKDFVMKDENGDMVVDFTNLNKVQKSNIYKIFLQKPFNEHDDSTIHTKVEQL